MFSGSQQKLYNFSCSIISQLPPCSFQILHYIREYFVRNFSVFISGVRSIIFFYDRKLRKWLISLHISYFSSCGSVSEAGVNQIFYKNIVFVSNCFHDQIVDNYKASTVNSTELSSCKVSTEHDIRIAIICRQWWTNANATSCRIEQLHLKATALFDS